MMYCSRLHALYEQQSRMLGFEDSCIIAKACRISQMLFPKRSASAPAVAAGVLVSRDGGRSHVAIKVIPTHDDAGAAAPRLREVALQEALDHCRWMARLRTSILPVRAVQDDAAGGCVRIITDTFDSTLAQWTKRRPDGRPHEQEWVRLPPAAPVQCCLFPLRPTGVGCSGVPRPWVLRWACPSSGAPVCDHDMCGVCAHVSGP